MQETILFMGVFMYNFRKHHAHHGLSEWCSQNCAVYHQLAMYGCLDLLLVIKTTVSLLINCFYKASEKL